MQAKELFILSSTEHTVIFRIDPEQLHIDARVWNVNEIVLTISPGDITNDEQLWRLMNFIHTIGFLLQKPVVMTPEGMPERYYCRFDPATREEILPHLGYRHRIADVQEMNLLLDLRKRNT